MGDSATSNEATKDELLKVFPTLLLLRPFLRIATSATRFARCSSSSEVKCAYMVALASRRCCPDMGRGSWLVAWVGLKQRGARGCAGSTRGVGWWRGFTFIKGQGPGLVSTVL